jgi:hypothetical protein
MDMSIPNYQLPSPIPKALMFARTWLEDSLWSWASGIGS